MGSSLQIIASASKWAVRRLRQWFVTRWADDLRRSRTASHVAVVLLLSLVVVLGGTSVLNLSLQQEREGPLTFPVQEEVVEMPAEPEAAPVAPLLPAAPAIPIQEDSVLVRAVVPHTIIPERAREEILTYVVQSGDTILGIAAKFGITGETIMWSNGRLEDNPDLLRVGQEVIILPVDGIYHQVGSNDTVSSIAGAFEVQPEAIISYPLNGLDPENPQIVAGQWLVVPGGVKPYVPRQVLAYSGPIPEDATKGSGIFGWPAAGTITQGFWGQHRAIDIGTWKGAPVTAADSGYVVAAGWDDSGYGRVVVIDHGNGFQTLYAHLDVYYVDVGNSVAKGEAIGEVGSTGNSSGPHLHFEVRQGGVQRNPFGFLP